jgi:hypothetical protein
MRTHLVHSGNAARQNFGSEISKGTNAMCGSLGITPNRR